MQGIASQLNDRENPICRLRELQTLVGHGILSVDGRYLWAPTAFFKSGFGAVQRLQIKIRPLEACLRSGMWADVPGSVLQTFVGYEVW